MPHLRHFRAFQGTFGAWERRDGRYAACQAGNRRNQRHEGKACWHGRCSGAGNKPLQNTGEDRNIRVKQTGKLLDGDKKTPRSFQTAVFFWRLAGNYAAGAVMFILLLLQPVLLLLPVL